MYFISDLLFLLAVILEMRMKRYTRKMAVTWEVKEGSRKTAVNKSWAPLKLKYLSDPSSVSIIPVIMIGMLLSFTSYILI